MARRVSANPRMEVACAECGAGIIRRPLNPRTGAPIASFYCNVRCKASAQRRARPVDGDWLRQKYVVEHLDCVQIGRLVGRDPKRVWDWLRSEGIPTRGRGEETGAHRFRLGQPSPFKGRAQPRGEASPSWRGGATPLRQAFYASPEWRAAAQATYGRAQKTCERCAATQRQVEAAGEKLHIHHALGFHVEALRAEPANLILLCGPCHRFVHSKANGDGMFLAREIAA